MTNQEIIEKLQEIEFVLFSIDSNSNLHAEEIPNAHATSQELLKYFSDLNKEDQEPETVYTSKHGTEYTEAGIYSLIDEWRNARGSHLYFTEFPAEHVSFLRDTLYDYVLNLSNGACPATILDEIDSEEATAILGKMGLKKVYVFVGLHGGLVNHTRVYDNEEEANAEFKRYTGEDYDDLLDENCQYKLQGTDEEDSTIEVSYLKI